MASLRFSDDGLPALFKAADRLSTDGQNRKRKFFFGFLCCDLAGALVAAFDLHSTLLSTLSLTFLAVGLLGSLLLLQEKPEMDWYGGRALAESVKTLSWRYMMCAEPYDHGLPGGEAERKLIDEMSALLKVERNLIAGLDIGSGIQITQQMKNIRSLTTVERKCVYAESRLENQRNWYASKGRRANLWLRRSNRLIVFIQFALVLEGISLVIHPNQLFSAVGLLSTGAAALVAWQQLSQFGALAAAYNLAALELSNLQSTIERVETERELQEFVINAERAISREHTLWRARRTE